MNAKLRSWPDIKVGNCYPHASRMVLRATRKRLTLEENAQIIRDEFRLLANITSTPIFEHAMML